MNERFCLIDLDFTPYSRLTDDDLNTIFDTINYPQPIDSNNPRVFRILSTAQHQIDQANLANRQTIDFTNISRREYEAIIQSEIDFTAEEQAAYYSLRTKCNQGQPLCGLSDTALIGAIFLLEGNQNKFLKFTSSHQKLLSDVRDPQLTYFYSGCEQLHARYLKVNHTLVQSSQAA